MNPVENCRKVKHVQLQYLETYINICCYFYLFSSKYFIFNHVLYILTHAAANKKTVITYLHNIDFCDLLQPISTPENENVTSLEINIVST